MDEKTTVKTYTHCTYDGERYATLCDGTLIQIDPQDAHLLKLGPWRRRSGHPSVMFNHSKQFLTLLSALVPENRPDVLVLRRDAKSLDYRRANLKFVCTVCPFSSGRLDELYWTQGKETKEIARLAAALTQTDEVTIPTVHRWLKEAGVRIRTKSEAAYRVSQRPEIKIKNKINCQGGRNPKGVTKFPISHFKRMAKLAGKARSVKKQNEIERFYPQHSCDLCGTPFRRAQSRVEKSRARGANIYCSPYCASRGCSLRRTGVRLYWPTHEVDAANPTEHLREARMDA